MIVLGLGIGLGIRVRLGLAAVFAKDEDDLLILCSEQIRSR
jgi:hypothetical protein